MCNPTINYIIIFDHVPSKVTDKNEVSTVTGLNKANTDTNLILYAISAIYAEVITVPLTVREPSTNIWHLSNMHSV